MMKINVRKYSSKGFTLVELMVSLAIASIVLIAMTTMFIQYNRLYTLENARATLQQEMRTAMDIMIRDIHMAAADSANTKNFKVKTSQLTRFRFAADMNGNGTLDSGAAATGGCEMISYRFSAANNKIDWICNENMAGQDLEPLIGDTEIQVTGLTFDYRNNQNMPESIEAEISGVEITMTARIPAGRAGIESRTLSAFVTLRNSGPNTSKS